MDVQRAADLIATHLAKQFSRRDYNWQILVVNGEQIVPLVISAENQVMTQSVFWEGLGPGKVELQYR